MTIRMYLPGFEWLEQYVWLILPLAFLGITWYHILQNYKKHPFPRTVMAALIAYTAFDVLLLVPGVLWSGFFFVTFLCLAFPFFLGVGNWLSRQRDRRCSAYTEGTVSDLRRCMTRKQVCYYPIIVFYVNGERYCEESPVPCTQEEFGKTCWVKYNPNDPHEITQEQYDDGDKVFRVISIILLCVATLCAIIGIADIAYIFS